MQSGLATIKRPVRLSIHPSDCLANAWIVTKQKKGLSRFYITRKIIQPNFLIRRTVGGRRPFLPVILCQTDPAGAKTPIFNWYSLVAPQREHSEKSPTNTNRKSTTCFSMSLRWTPYVALSAPPPKKRGGLKNAVSKIWTIICDNFETLRDRM